MMIVRGSSSCDENWNSAVVFGVSTLVLVLWSSSSSSSSSSSLKNGRCGSRKKTTGEGGKHNDDYDPPHSHHPSHFYQDNRSLMQLRNDVSGRAMVGSRGRAALTLPIPYLNQFLACLNVSSYSCSFDIRSPPPPQSSLLSFAWGVVVVAFFARMLRLVLCVFVCV